MHPFGLFLYLMFLVLGVMFLKQRAGRNLDQLINDDEHLHHHVHRVIASHDKGGGWREHTAWMGEEA